MYRGLNVAVIIPCLNEEKTIGDVVRRFKAVLPDVPIYVYDNDSSDDTWDMAFCAGAYPKFCPRRGKGNVIRQAVSDVRADYYLFTDGDGNLLPEDAPKLLDALIDKSSIDGNEAGRGIDMVIGDRLNASYFSCIHDPIRRSGNWILKKKINKKYWWAGVSDVLSGYRAISRRYFDKYPVISDGFEIETEMTVNLVKHRGEFVYRYVPVRYENRKDGSRSKMSIADGIKILKFLHKMIDDD